MEVGVPRESDETERRVAITPAAAETLNKSGHRVHVEPGAGVAAGFPDAAYADADAAIDAPLPVSEAVVVVGPPPPAMSERLQPGAVLVGFLEPFTNRPLIEALLAADVTALAFEAVPRITLAQPADALSSQATASGYAATLLAASESPRFFPMLTTAAGTVPPAKVLVLGTGVAGLQAIATARRLGARVSAYDIRPEAREQVESLGARFVAAPTTEAAADSGYAREVSADIRTQQLEALAPHVADADVLITTAAVPGKPAPVLATTTMIEAMGPGAVVVDLAASTGGNCEPTVAGDEVRVGGALVLGPLDLASRVAMHASEMYARNVVELLTRYSSGGLEDDVVAGTCVAHRGAVTNERTKTLIEGAR